MLNLIDKIENLMYIQLAEMTLVLADKVGLDSRCGSMYVSNDCIVTRNDKQLSYYGGFEYVDSEYKTVIGDFAIYSIEDDRVEEAIHFYNNSK